MSSFIMHTSVLIVSCFVLLQIVAITVFFLLCIAFYAFFAPFLGKDLYEYVAMAVYSFLVSCLILLLAKCEFRALTREK